MTLWKTQQRHCRNCIYFQILGCVQVEKGHLRLGVQACLILSYHSTIVPVCCEHGEFVVVLVKIWGGWIYVVWLKCLLERWLINLWKTCVHTGTHSGIHPYKFYFRHVGNKVRYCIFKICYTVSVLFLTRCHLSHNFMFFCSSNKLLIKWCEYDGEYPP